MLPDIRAAVAALVAAVGLLMISFGVVATWRVAQENQSGPLQADLRRNRVMQPASAGQRPVTIIETPGPHLAPKATPLDATPTTPVEIAAPLEPLPEPAPPPQIEAAQAALPAPPAEPAVGGPLAEPPVGGPPALPPEISRTAAAENPSRADTRAIERAAAAKAKARAARIARERKAAIRRAAQVRRAKQKASGNTSSFGGTFGGTFTTPNSPPQ